MLRRLRLRIFVLAVTLTFLAILAWEGAALTGEIRAAIWIAILFVGFFLGITSYSYIVGPWIEARLR
jgi:hypothetical protein